MRGAPVFLGLLLVLGACSSSASEEAVPTGSTAVAEDSITVVVSLPHQAGILYGTATGRVVAEDGTEVSRFAFESGWDTPPGWEWGDPTPSRSQAFTELDVQLPAAGSYTFELDTFTTSGGPCGTCEAALVDQGPNDMVPRDPKISVAPSEVVVIVRRDTSKADFWVSGCECRQTGE